MNYISRFIYSFFTVILLIAFNTGNAQIKVGILPRLAASELTKMFTPLCDQISQEIGEKIELVIPKDFDTFNKMLKEGQFNYAFSNPNVYVEARSSLGEKVVPLAIAVETGSGKSFTGCFLVKKGSSVKSVKDFKGKKLIFVDEKSAGGYLSQLATMAENGITKSDVTILPFAKKHTNVALAIQNGAADVGGIRTMDFEKIKSQVSIPDVQILSESESIPNWPFYALQNADPQKTEKILKALLALSPKSAKAKTVLQSAKLDGFVPASDADFDSMRKIAQAAKGF